MSIVTYPPNIHLKPRLVVGKIDIAEGEMMDERELRAILSANIKRYRNRKEWSQIRLAEKLDISANFLADIETGKSWISSLTLVKLANVLDISVYELFLPLTRPENTKNAETDAKIKEILTRFTNDMTIALDDSVSQALHRSLKNVLKQYLP
jgi:transcriptional regulator with XRE-family HTH domain